MPGTDPMPSALRRSSGTHRSAPWPRSRRAIPAMIVALTVLAGCGDGDGDETAAEQAGDTLEGAAESVGDALDAAWASLTTNSERLVDEIQTSGDPQAKQELLDHCRDVLQQLRDADSERVDEVESLCDRIRDTNADDRDAWDEIEGDIDRLAA